jgi:hypothetical protein
MSRQSYCCAALHLLLFVFLFASSKTTFSQDASTGAIRGTVVDSSGRRIVGASVALVNTATGFRHSTKSDSEGVFAFQLLPAGNYFRPRRFSGDVPSIDSPPIRGNWRGD